jgi:hypothetical protein
MRQRIYRIQMSSIIIFLANEVDNYGNEGELQIIFRS